MFPAIFTSYLAMLSSLLHLLLQRSNVQTIISSSSYLFSVQLTMSNSTSDIGLQPHRLILYQNIFRRLLFFRIPSEKVVKCFLFENSSSRNPFSQMAFKPGARIGHFGQFVKIKQNSQKCFDRNFEAPKNSFWTGVKIDESYSSLNTETTSKIFVFFLINFHCQCHLIPFPLQASKLKF